MNDVARFLFVVEGDPEAMTLQDEDAISRACVAAEETFRAALPEKYSVKVEDS